MFKIYITLLFQKFESNSRSNFFEYNKSEERDKKKEVKDRWK